MTTVESAHEVARMLDGEAVELLPDRAALGGWCYGPQGGINITTVTAINIAIAVNAGGAGSSAVALALQGISIH